MNHSYGEYFASDNWRSTLRSEENEAVVAGSRAPCHLLGKKTLRREKSAWRQWGLRICAVHHAGIDALSPVRHY